MPRRLTSLASALAVGRKALAAGGEVVTLPGSRIPRGVRWLAAPRCFAPVPIELVGLQETKARGKSILLNRRGFTVWMEVECRKCPACLKQRATRWRAKANCEISQSARTWFGTLTLSPEWHYTMQCRASVRLSKQGVDFATLSQDEQFSERNREIGAEITKWLKRVRKESRSRLRYCLTVEAHISGLPHYHCLIHEMSSDTPVRWATLHDQWICGFSLMKLVENGSKAAWYVSKYLSKDARSRVRASFAYGKIRPDATAPLTGACESVTPKSTLHVVPLMEALSYGYECEGVSQAKSGAGTGAKTLQAHAASAQPTGKA